MSPFETEFSNFNTGISEILTADSESDICNLAVENAAMLFEVDLVGLWLYDSDAQELQLAAQTPQADELFGTDIVYCPGNSASWEAFEKGELFHFSAETDTVKYNDESVVQNELIIPIENYGVINIASQTPEPFSEDKIDMAKTFGTVVKQGLNHVNEKHELRVQNNRLEEVISLVSHDLRNPLTVAQGRTNYVLNQVTDSLVENHLETTTNSLDRMETLIEDLLMLSQDGFVVEERTTLDLNSLAKEAWENVDTKHAGYNVRDQITIFGEKKRLLQVFENLFRNAVEHGGEDVTITIRDIERMETTTRGGDSTADEGFIFEDDGDGLPDDDDFEVFKSGESTSGSGLGLTIVQRIVEAHGWNVSAHNSPTGGAQFRIVSGEKSITPFKE